MRQACEITDEDGLEVARAKIRARLEGSEDGDLIASRVASATGLSTDNSGLQETFWAIRQLLEWLGRDRPLVLIFDDLHWGQPTLLDLIEYLAGWTRGTALLLLCLARPDLTDVRPTWSSGVSDASTLSLTPLDVEDAERFLKALVGPSILEEGVLNRIQEAAEDARPPAPRRPPTRTPSRPQRRT